MDFPTPTRGSDFSAQLNSWLVSSALSIQYNRHKAAEPLLTVDELDDLLYAEALDKGADRFVESSASRSRGFMDYSELARHTADAAAYAMEIFEPEKVTQRARKGGQRSKRKPVYSVALLAGCDGLTIKETAAKLQISERAVSRLRQRAAQQSEHERYDEILGFHEPDPIIAALLVQTFQAVPVRGGERVGKH